MLLGWKKLRIETNYGAVYHKNIYKVLIGNNIIIIVMGNTDSLIINIWLKTFYDLYNDLLWKHKLKSQIWIHNGIFGSEFKSHLSLIN